jgi:putative Holliday junction resolvase
LAVDVGDKRTGLAVGDAETGIVTPLGVVALPLGYAKRKRGGGAAYEIDAGALIGRLVEIALEEEAERVVVGLPLHMDGAEGDRARLVRAFGAALEGALLEAGAVAGGVVFADERRSSARADEWMARSGLTHKQKKRRRDALAAAAFLGAYLEELD